MSSKVQAKRSCKSSQVRAFFGAIDTGAGTLAAAITPNAHTYASTDVTVAADTITIAAHGFSLYQPVRITAAGTIATGLAGNATYYIIYVDVNTISLASSLANAKAGTAVTITNAGAGNSTIYHMGFFIEDHGFVTGDRTQVVGAGLPTGIAALTDYWVIKSNDDHYELATSYANAIAGTAIAWTILDSQTPPSALMTTTATDKLVAGPDYLGWSMKAISTGVYRVYFKEPVQSVAFYSAIPAAITADVIVRVKSKAKTYVEIEVKENDGAPVAIDGHFSLFVTGSLAKYLWA